MSSLSLFMLLVSFCWGAQVLKFLMERNSISALHGQVTVGTLILQVYIFSRLYSVVFIHAVNILVQAGLISAR